MATCWECGQDRGAELASCQVCGAPADAPFEPRIIYYDEMRLTEFIMADVTTVWSPWRATAHMGHAIDLGYDMETGELVGVKIWDDVRKRTVT